MPESRDQSPGDDYFNDLSQQPSKGNEDTKGDRRNAQKAGNGQVPKPKRIACVLCRKRKLKCDGLKPSCGTCSRLSHDCSYDQVRRKSGPKRGYVKALEARLAQLEALLKTQDEPQLQNNQDTPSHSRLNGMAADTGNITSADTLSHMSAGSLPQDLAGQANFTLPTAPANQTATEEELFPWELIGLGLDEPLPTQDVINELNQIYFEKVHPSLPIVHRPRYYAGMNLAPHVRPPVCLRYAMWASAAAVSDKYDGLQEHFYQRSRKYIQQDEMKDHGDSMITVAHCQTWALLATHELKLMYFPRAWMSAGRACHMSQMMGLHRLDGTGLDVKKCLPPPKDWTEREERRRTFWMCFCVDRYSSIGTRWPMTLEEKDIMTSLPAEEECFEYSRPTKTVTLADSLDMSGPPNLSSFAGVVLTACLFGRNLTHLHLPGPDDQDDQLNDDFWKRHRSMNNILLNTALALPDPLRLPSGLNNPNTVFMNMSMHTSTICLHQAAILRADKNRMPARISAESEARFTTAAAEIASIMREICHADLATMNPFIPVCLYVAARVFVQYLKSRPDGAQVKASLQFLLSAMNAIQQKNPLTEYFLVQPDVDLEGARPEDSDPCHPERNTSADGSGDHNTPNSSTNSSSRHDFVSSHTSNAGCSPPDQQNPDVTAHGLLMDGSASATMLDAKDAAVSADFEMNTCPPSSAVDRQPQGFVLPQTWSGNGSSGLTPGPTGMTAGASSGMMAGVNGMTPGASSGMQTGMNGMTPGASSGMMAGMNDMMTSMTDAGWNQMMESFTVSGWDAELDHNHSIQEFTGGRRIWPGSVK